MFPARGALRDTLAAHFYDWSRSVCGCGWRPADVDDYVPEHLEHLAGQIDSLGWTNFGSPESAAAIKAQVKPSADLAVRCAPAT